MARYRPIRDSIRFGYAVGRVRVLETRLLKRSHFERLLDARDFAEQRRVLSETIYGTYLEQAMTAEDVEIAIDRALADLYADFLETANLPEGIVTYFRTLHDFENVRGLLKAEALGIDPTEMLNELGSMDADRLGSGALSPRVAGLVQAVRTEAGSDEPLEVGDVDLAVDKALYRTLAGIAQTAANPHVRQMALVGADLASVKAFARLKNAGAGLSEFERHVMPGGTIEPADVAAVARLSLPEALGRLTSRPTLRGIDVEALADPTRFDVVADALVVRRLDDARRVAVGPEPVVAYVMQRKLEASMLRMLLIGKLAGVSRDVLRTRLRDVA